MSAYNDSEVLRARIERRTGKDIGHADANVLRRAEKTLQHWAELECGSDSGCVERDDVTGRPYWRSSDGLRRWPTTDREAGALRRIRAVCERHGLNFYHQGDPRGAALYVDSKPIPADNYSAAVCCAVD